MKHPIMVIETDQAVIRVELILRVRRQRFRV